MLLGQMHVLLQFKQQALSLSSCWSVPRAKHTLTLKFAYVQIPHVRKLAHL
jgi:hypothetical protein